MNRNRRLRDANRNQNSGRPSDARKERRWAQRIAAIRPDRLPPYIEPLWAEFSFVIRPRVCDARYQFM